MTLLVQISSSAYVTHISFPGTLWRAILLSSFLCVACIFQAVVRCQTCQARMLFLAASHAMVRGLWLLNSHGAVLAATTSLPRMRLGCGGSSTA